MKRKILVFIFFIGVIIIAVFYNIYDNNRIKVVEENIQVDNLPESFKGFKILLIADLHGKSFGDDQEKLIDLINSLDYDVIALAGDMGNYHTDDITPFIQMLDGIENKDCMFYIQGNNGPQDIDSETGEITEIGQYLISKGCILLNKPYKITRGDDVLWVSELIRRDEFQEYYPEVTEDQCKIAITHYPMNQAVYDNNQGIFENYSLVLAAHYHAGQWRIPFYGAVFVPEVNTGDGWFPNQDEVKGLKTYGEFKQYITAGLGASSKFKFLEFRLFNTPEINLLTLE